MAELVLRDYQQEIMEKLREGFRAGHRVQMLYSPTGGGKCLGFDTPVLMADGRVVPVQDVRPGDRLASPTGGFRTVLTIAQGHGPLYEVTPVKGDPYVVNSAHILSLRKTPTEHGLSIADGSRISHDADIVNVNIEVFDRSNKTAQHCLKGWRSAADFDGAPVPMDPYILGVWLGDGHMGHPVISKPHGAVVEAWAAHGARMGVGCSCYQGTRANDCPSWRLTNGDAGGQANPVTAALKSLGVLNRKHIPHAFKVAPRAERLALIAGLLDTDGHMRVGGYDWISVDEQMARDFAFVCRSVGLAAYVSKQRKGIKSIGFSGEYWRVGISGDCDIIPCKQKPAGARGQKKRHLVHGIKVRAIGDGDYYGFELDGDRLFMLGDFTVTHNTEMAVSLLKATSEKYKRGAMILDRIVLCNQTSARLQKYGVDHGVMQAGHWRNRPYERVQVCSAQTLEKRGSFPGLNILIVDEAHDMRLQTLEFIKNNPDVKVVGLSATPFSDGLGAIYTNVVSSSTTSKLVEAGNLVKLRVFISKEIDMTGAKKIAGEWSMDGAAERGMKITGDVVSEWAAKTMEIYGKPVKTIVFASNVAHGADLAEQFGKAGYNFVAISYKDTDEYKADVLADFARPDTAINGVIACSILTKGYDEPSVLMGISARPYSKSFKSHVQEMGRVMRPFEGKEFATWLCFSGNYLRFQEDWDELYHGGVTELKDGREKAKKEKSAEEKKQAKCPKCSALWVGNGDVCSVCGYHRPRRNMVETVDGEMQELKGSPTRDVKQAWYSQLLTIAQERGYSSGWCAHKYKEKFGVWPRNLADTPAPVTLEVFKWEKSRRIAWAKGKKAA